MSSYDALLAQALALSGPERGRLAARLLGSLEPEDERLSAEEWDAAWTAEVLARQREVHEGRVEAIEGGEARARVRAAIAARRT